MDKLTAADLLDNLIGMVNDTNGNNYDDALKMGIEALKADAVDVVRCKDCMLCQYDAIFKQYWCIGKPVKADDYCSMGVRKKDG